MNLQHHILYFDGSEKSLEEANQKNPHLQPHVKDSLIFRLLFG